MTREELGASLNLQIDFIPKANRNRTGGQLYPTAIAIHNTDNTSLGADALAHARHLIQNEGDSGYGPTSWHYTVDDTRVVKHLPLGEQGIHAYASGNRVSIGIEMCMNSNGNWESTVDRAARLAAVLCFDFGWSSSALKQHHDFPRSNGTRKNCPSRIRSELGGIAWQDFLSLTVEYLTSIMQNEGFTFGFLSGKELAPASEEVASAKNNDIKETDRDHGSIQIPKELLSE